MKRLLSLIVALCLLSGATALATELNPGNSAGTTILSVTIDAAYTLVIPAAVPIVYGAEQTGLTLQVTQCRLPVGSVLNVACSDDGTLSTPEGAQLPYRLLYSGVAVRAISFDAVGAKTLTVAISPEDWETAAAGNYTDIVTFSASIR